MGLIYHLLIIYRNKEIFVLSLINNVLCIIRDGLPSLQEDAHVLVCPNYRQIIRKVNDFDEARCAARIAPN